MDLRFPPQQEAFRAEVRAFLADKIFCLVRTSSEGKPQEGVSFVLVDMNAPGVELRPIRLLDGRYAVNEVFFTHVRAPVSNLVRGGRPLVQDPVFAAQMTEVEIALEAMRVMNLRILSAASKFGDHDGWRYVAMAKNLIGRTAALISEECIQLHGGIGMTWEYPGAHYAKRLSMIDHQLGDRYAQIQRLAA